MLRKSLIFQMSGTMKFMLEPVGTPILPSMLTILPRASTPVIRSVPVVLVAVRFTPQVLKP
ncbi:hypothetical protein D3C72_1152690 [compost metagenome]